MRASWALLLVTACVDTSLERVKLTAAIDDASVAVQEEVLVTALTGGFSLTLERGDLSETSAQVETPPSFRLLSANGVELSTLDASPSPGLPWSVSPDQSITVTYTLTEQNLLEVGVAESVCAGQVLISGLVEPADGDPLTVQSSPVTPSGCN